jgi:SAM-dependent methyltransferase
MPFDLSRRSQEAELMDAADTDYDTFRDCLRDLARVNVLSMGYRPTLAFLDGLRRSGRLPTRGPVRVLDVGSGYGDLLRTIDHWAERHGIEVHLTGIDLSPWSARAAREVTDEGRPINWVTGDIFEHQGGADVVVSSLFTHHLDDAGVVRFLRWMEERAQLGWMINDLHRHILPYSTFGALAAALRWHRFVRHDGPVSFARSFVAAEWRSIVAQAAIPAQQVTVQRWFPFRLCVSRVRPD